MLGGIGMQELIVIMVIVMLIFGAKRLPELGSGLGKAIHGFKKATEEPVESLKDLTRIEAKESRISTVE